MAETRSKANRKSGRPSLCESQKSKRCDCGGKTGKTVCKMAVSCGVCGRHMRGCSSNNNCALMQNKKSNNREKVCARLLTGVINCKQGDLDVERLLNATPPSIIKKNN